VQVAHAIVDNCNSIHVNVFFWGVAR